MKLRRDIGFREYLHRKGRSRLIGDAYTICAMIVAGQIFPVLEQHLSSGVVLAPVVRDPFTVLAGAFLVLSYTDLDFMEFRLREAGWSAPSDMDRLAKQREIPKRYNEAYGMDAFLRCWRVRFVSILFFAIAALHWMLTWNK